MILSQDINPKQSLYFIGGKVLKILKNQKNRKVDLLAVYKNLKASDDISMALFILSMDWLFLVGTVQADSEGKITYVS